MNEEEMIEQLYSLIEDRNTFIIEDESIDCEIFKKDIRALKTIIKSYKHDKLCLSGYRDSILRQCGRSQTKLQVVEDILLQNDKLKRELSKKEKIIDELKDYAWELKQSGYREAGLSFLDKIKELEDKYE